MASNAKPATKAFSNGVSAILKQKSKMTHIDFKVNTIHVKSDYIADVGRAIDQGKIKIMIDGTIKFSCQYHTGKNEITFHPSHMSLTSLLITSTIVHEGIHAANDIRVLRKVPGVDEEAAAYIGQAIYIINRTGSQSDRMLAGKGTIDRKQIEKVYIAANTAAKSVINKSRFFKSDVENVRKALRNVPSYNSVVNNTVTHDGV